MDDFRLPRAPFLIVNLKSYLSREQTLRLGECADSLSLSFETDIFITAQPLHLADLSKAAPDLLVTAQHMDADQNKASMGRVLPETLVEVGAKAVMLNHASHHLALNTLDLAINSAKEYGLLTLVCADSESECRAVAELGPTIVICEPTSHIGTGTMISGDYVARTTAAVKHVNSEILVVQAAGVSCGADIRRLLEQGADGSGGTMAVVGASDWGSILRDMLTSISDYRMCQTRSER